MKFATLLIALAATTIQAANITLNAFARDLTRVESIRAIKNVQRTFAQLAQFGRYADIAPLFSSNGTLIWGNETATGALSIWFYLTSSAGPMNGITPGSLDTTVVETPVISLSADGNSAKGRWNGLRFQGDGQGNVRIQGGVYENEYVLSGDEWKISLLHYHALYDTAGRSYKEGWRNVGGVGIPIVPYHFTSEGSGVPIPEPVGEVPDTKLTIEEMEKRVQRLNDEDEVRNLMHAHGFYVDRRMWTDVVDLHTSNTSVIVRGSDSTKTYTGLTGVREALERMGPEGLTQGINNDHPIFSMIVEVQPNGREAAARGIEIAMIGDVGKKTASWEFNVFRNSFVKENGVWKVQTIDTTPLIVADYYEGWGHGGLNSPNLNNMPPFLNTSIPSFVSSTPQPRPKLRHKRFSDLADLKRRLLRSAAYDGSENQSHAYGYYADDLDCARLGALFAYKGNKLSPFAGKQSFPIPFLIWGFC